MNLAIGELFRWKLQFAALGFFLTILFSKHNTSSGLISVEDGIFILFYASANVFLFNE